MSGKIVALFVCVWSCAAAPCPPASQVQSRDVVAHYDVQLAQGLFYEVFYDDIVESACSCFLKTRTVTNTSLHDEDRLFCGAMGKGLWVNVTEDNYFIENRTAAFDLVMNSPLINKVHFPNLVLGYGEATEAGAPYEWTVEFQCIDRFGHAVYTGFNIYHRSWQPPESDIAAIRQWIARAQVIVDAGLGSYWDSGQIKPMGGGHCNYTTLQYA